MQREALDGYRSSPLPSLTFFKVFDSVITLESGLSKVILSNRKKARLEILKLRATLVSGTFRVITECRPKEVIIKLNLLHALETSITKQISARDIECIA